MVESSLVVVVDRLWLSFSCVLHISVGDSYGADNDLKLEKEERTKQMQHTMAANGEVRVYCEGKKGRAKARPK